MPSTRRHPKDFPDGSVLLYPNLGPYSGIAARLVGYDQSARCVVPCSGGKSVLVQSASLLHRHEDELVMYRICQTQSEKGQRLCH